MGIPFERWTKEKDEAIDRIAKALKIQVTRERSDECDIFAGLTNKYTLRFFDGSTNTVFTQDRAYDKLFNLLVLTPLH